MRSASRRATRPEPTISVRWRSFGVRWAVIRAPERVTPATAAQASAPKNAPAAGRSTAMAVSSPNSGHETARQVSTSRGASLTPLDHARRSSRAYRPHRKAATGQATASTAASSSVCGQAGVRDDADERAADETGDGVGDEEQTAEMLEAAARGVGAAGKQLQLQCFSVHGHQANLRHVSILNGIPTSIPSALNSSRSIQRHFRAALARPWGRSALELTPVVACPM